MSRPGHIAFVLSAFLPLVAGAQGTVRTRAPVADVIEQLGDRVPEEGRLIDSEGQPFRLADELHRGKPVVLALVYYRCPQLCNLTLSGLTRSLRDSGMKPGRDYRAVIVSIDPTETSRDAAESKRGHMQGLGISPTTNDWRFATAAEPEIQALARATGFKYRYDRLRPYDLDTRIERLETPNFPAYPSAHSGNSWVAAYVFSELLPAHRDVFERGAAEMAFSREILGVHFPSDSTSGRALARQIVDRLKAVPAFQKDAEAARAEIASARRDGRKAAASTTSAKKDECF